MNSQTLSFPQNIAPPSRPPSQYDPFAGQPHAQEIHTPAQAKLKTLLLRAGNKSLLDYVNCGVSGMGEHPAQERPTPRFAGEQLRTLQQHYALVSNAASITEVLTDVPALYGLLKAAVEPLRLAFGEKKILKIEGLESDEGSLLRVVVQLPAGTDNPAKQMRGFKGTWWLKNCARAEASLVFDYEIGDEI